MRQHNWMRALDLQMDQLKWQHSDFGTAMTISFFEDLFVKQDAMQHGDLDYGETAREAAIEMDRNFKAALYRADTIFVTKDMEHILLQAAHDLPPEVTFDIRTLITPYGFVLLEETLYGIDRHGSTIAINGFVWMVGKDKRDLDRDVIVLYFLTPTDDPTDEINSIVIPIMRADGHQVPPFAIVHFLPAIDGDRLPHSDVDGVPPQGAELIVGMTKLFVAMQLLAQQRIGQPQKMVPDRATRKRVQRQWGDGDRLITLITLRRKSIKKDDHEPRKVDWSRRWLVRAHWRRQPDKRGWHWVYIYEFVKGPDDKPFIPTDRRIFDFRR